MRIVKKKDGRKTAQQWATIVKKTTAGNSKKKNYKQQETGQQLAKIVKKAMAEKQGNGKQKL